MGALPTESVESEVVKAWQSQQASAGTRGTGGTGCTGGKAAKPAGVVVFRRGKLPMRVGMSEAEFTQVRCTHTHMHTCTHRCTLRLAAVA